MYKYHEIITVKDINDREEILNTLSFIETDEDFNGNNGEEFTREEAIESGFKSTHEYVIDVLRNSGLTGEKLILAFFEQWLGKDGYYDTWDFEGAVNKNGNYVCSVFAIHED